MPFTYYRCIISILLTISLSLVTVYGQHVNRCSSESPINYHPESLSPAAYPRNEIVIPVVFHIVWHNSEENISDELIYSQMQAINDDYSQNNVDIINVPERFQKDVGNPGIRFCIAPIGPEGQNITGIVRVQTDIADIGGQRQEENDYNLLKRSSLGGSDAWNPEQYLNVWVSARSDNVLGFATFPNDPLVKPHEDGIEIDYRAFGLRDDESQFDKGRTLTHEIAHYLNVDHLWGKTISCYNEGDHIDDTPEQGEAYFGCIDQAVESCGSRDMAHNFLNFLDDDCLWYFTKGQSDRMLDALYRFRYSLISSRICSDSQPVPSDPLDIATTRLTPFGFQINLSFMPQVDYQLELYDMQGRFMWEEVQNGLSIHIIDTFNYPTGIYILRIDQGDQSSVKKVFITH